MPNRPTRNNQSRRAGPQGAARLRASAAIVALCALAPVANAASSKGCEGGGFTLLTPTGAQVVPGQRTTVPAGALGAEFTVRGRYVTFTVDSATFGIRNYTLTGAPNPLDITGGVPTVVFASKMPDHRGLVLTGDAQVRVKDTEIRIQRGGPGLEMKIQAKDCPTGGIFQMEPERGDDTPTRFTHVLAPGVFYFDNQNFRDREGDVLPYKDTTVRVTNRINFGNDVSARFVGRDSAQVATRVLHPSCPNGLPNRPSIGGSDSPVQHCGGVSQWDVASGGRMGQVMGEDAVEVAPGATDCTEDCQAQNRVRGQAAVLGFPFPPTNRLTPRQP